MIAVRQLDPHDDRTLCRLYALYRSVTMSLVHGFPATEEEFRIFARRVPHLRSGVTLLAAQEGVPLGFVRAGLFCPVPDRWSLAAPGEGMLFGPFVSPEHTAAGEMLLTAASVYLRERGATYAFAFDPVEAVGAPGYNGGWCGLPDTLSHIVGIYARAGFRLRGRELCLTRPDLPVDEIPPLAAPLSLAYETRDRNRHAVKLYERTFQAGSCYYSRMFPARSARPEAARWGYIDGLSVAESHQGRGLGRLLMLHALHRLRALGCGPISLTTAHDNFRAQNLYFSLGFALTDSCVVLSGSLGSLDRP